MKSDGPVISPALARSASTTAVTRCSGARRRARASAVARSHWSASRGHRGLAQSQRADRQSAVTGLGADLEEQPQPTAVLQLVPAGRQVEHGHAVQTVGQDHLVARKAARRRRRPRGHGGRAVARQHRIGAARPDRAGAAQPARPGWWRQGDAARRRRSPDRRVRGGATSPSPTGPATLPSARTATARFPGDWNAAAEQITARASDRASSSGPQISMRSNARRSTAAGRFGCTRWTARSRCRADAAAGSTWSIGARVRGAPAPARVAGCTRRTAPGGTAGR